MASSTFPALDSAITSETGWLPSTDADRKLVRRQIERILASPLFRNSKRFPAFVLYTVEHALKPEAGPLKERTIGIEVFGREPMYDTSQDPVVRMTAAEVRKRLAQYYQSAEDLGELRIVYEPGSYVPEFARLDTPTETGAAPEAALPARARRRHPWLAATAALFVAAAALAILARWRLPPSSDRPIDQFWEPFLRSPNPVLLCIGDPVGVRDGGQTASDLELIRRNYVRYTDSATLALLAGELGERHKAFRIRRPASTEFIDLRDGPSVLIGGFNNPWTLRLSEDLRFTLAWEGGTVYIRDRQHPENRAWKVTFSQPSRGDVSDTYGIATRMLDSQTGQTVLMTSGLRYGTRAAAECLVDGACMAEAKRRAPGDWPHRNIQIVVATQVIAEDSGPPRIVAVHLW